MPGRRRRRVLSAEAGPAAAAWRADLERWAIPPEILEAAPESPWGFPVKLFARRADEAEASPPSASARRALEALPQGGGVLDVGCGAGAAALALAGRAGSLVGVDPSAEMLAAFGERAAARGLPLTTLRGGWPDVADRTPVADVAVCHHVFYNVADLGEFALALTAHGRRRVVVELTDRHPLTLESGLWLRFHDLTRPDRPTADDAVAVLREVGLSPEREDWEGPPKGGHESMDELVAATRRLLCLPAERDPEVRAALQETATERDGRWFAHGPRGMVTLWWPGAG